MKTVASLFLALSLVSAADGAEYFVSPRGNDAAAGSAAAALATVGKGVSLLKAGDTLTILPGEYREAVEARKLTGTKDAPITIRAQRAGTVLLRGDVEVVGWQTTAIAGMFAVSFDGTAQGVADPRTLTHYEPAASASEIRSKPGAFYQDAESNRLLVRTLDGRTPSLLLVSITNGNGLTLENCSHLVVEGLTFTGYQHADTSVMFGSRTRWGVLASKSEFITLRRCTAYLNSGGLCFTTGTANSVIEECFVFGNASRTIGISNQILGWGAKDCVFRRNRIEGFNGAGSQDQITFYSNSGHANLLENNTAIRASFMDKGEADNVRVAGNITTGPSPQFYRPEDASNLRVLYTNPAKLSAQFADPVNGDFRLLPESPQRGKGLNGADPGPSPFREEVFFVSTEGDDSASGLSPTKPWKSLKHAAARAKAGDTIYLLPGVYAEAIRPARSGTAEKPIRFVRYADGRVILDGKGMLPVGVDLSGRSHIEVEGIVVRNFAQQGVKATDGAGITLSHLTIGGSGADALNANKVSALTLRHCFLDRSADSAVRLEQCDAAVLTGNLWGDGTRPCLVCDALTLAGLWSDRNHFTPATLGPLVAAGDQTYVTLADWQKTGLDVHSLSADPGLEDRQTKGDGVLLRANSPLVGRGPLAAAIGPFRRLISEQPVPVEQPHLHSATPTTANLECRTPSAPVEITLEWGDTPALGQKRTAVADVAHSISLVGLKPGTTYHARYSTAIREPRIVFATDREVLPAGDAAAAQGDTITFTTPASAAPPRTFHVAPDGDDSRDGLARDRAWRSINHAAEHAVAGDTVLVHTGTYEETITVRGTGAADAPLTFRTAPGAVVWLTGSDRLRSTAFVIKEKSHIVLDGFRFRDFLSEESSRKSVVVILGGSHNTVRRCFYDGRVLSGYMNVFLGMSDSPDALVENCVMILGMGEGMSLHTCPRSVVRHCVFYNNNIRALSVMSDTTGALYDPVTVTHNLFCAVIPAKGSSAFIRARQLRNLVSDDNVYFDRFSEDKRSIVETMFIGDKKVGQPKPGSYDGQDFTLAAIRTETGNEMHSRFGNPGIAVVKQLSPRYEKATPDSNERTWQAQWMANELHQTRREVQPLDFADFIAAPDNPLAKAADGKPIGLDPAAFVRD